MGKNIKKAKKTNVFVSTFAMFDKEKPLDKYLPAIMLLRGVDVVMTSIFGLLIGIFAPLCIIIGTDDAVGADSGQDALGHDVPDVALPAAGLGGVFYI